MPHCWECRRKRLVCDGTLPDCKKCEQRRVVCPGYNKKPFKFVPQRTTLRQIQPKIKPSTGENDSTDQVKPNKSPESDTTVVLSGRPASKPSLTTPLRTLYDDFFDSSRYIRQWFASLLGGTLIGPFAQAQNLRMFSRTTSVEMMGAVAYALSVHTFGLDDSRQADIMKLRLLSTKTKAYQQLRSFLVDLRRQNTGAAINSIYSLTLVELISATSDEQTSWRKHAEGVMVVTNRYGGLQHTVNLFPECHVELYRISMWCIHANTTSPAMKQLYPEAFASPTQLAWLEKWHREFNHIAFPCPWPLRSLIIRINHLRSQGSDVSPTQCLAVHAAAQAFNPEQWCASTQSDDSPFRQTWLLFARVVQQAILIFASATLPFSRLSPTDQPSTSTSEIPNPQALLFELLRSVPLPAPRALKLGLVWPVVVAGYAAAAGPLDERDLVRGWLNAGRFQKSSATTRRALHVLERFWASGLTEWDECFDEPYLLAP